MAQSNEQMLAELLAFVRDEQAAGLHKLLQVWERPLEEKLQSGWSQRFVRLERGPDPGTAWAWIEGHESRFREGDMLALHAGKPLESLIARGVTLDSEEDERWLLRGRNVAGLLDEIGDAAVYADPDTIDLTSFYEEAIEEIGESDIGCRVVLPLLAGTLAPEFDGKWSEAGEQAARARGFNPAQASAVGLAYGARQLACIQGPPGTGKSSVLALVARLMVERGDRVLVTSHTHMAINNALNKIAAEGVALAKIGLPTQRKGLDDAVPCHGTVAEWSNRPGTGCVIGATPFATCTPRLAQFEFDTILFDEASQVTVPLALMAMRKGRRYVFVGDQRQLPPVQLSRSVLDEDGMSAFARLVAHEPDHSVMLNQTYRMCRPLAAWPSRTYYGGKLLPAGSNADRRLSLSRVPQHLRPVLDPDTPGVFIPTRDRRARTQNFRDGQCVAELCAAAIAGGLPPREIAVVTPYRAQGRVVRTLLHAALGAEQARAVVCDTVERMQGQERELVIVSLATGDKAFLDAVSSFFFQPQRLNVAITRARTKLIVIGPDIDRAPELEHPQVRQWVAEYADLLRHLMRVAP